MNDKVLDSVLQYLSTNSNGNNIDGREMFEKLSIQNNSPYLSFLKERGLIEYDVYEVVPNKPWHISIKITPNGKKFIIDGGFQKETFLKEEPIRQATEANKLSRKSLARSSRANIIAIISIIVSVLLAILLFLFEKEYLKL